MALIRLLQAPVLQSPVSAFSSLQITTNDNESQAIPPMPTLSEPLRPNMAPSDSSATVADDELYCKAKSLALLKLLQAPILQGSESAPSLSQPIARENGSQTFSPTPNPSGLSISMVSPGTVLPFKSCPSIILSLCPHNNKQKLLKTALQSCETTQLLAPHNTFNTFSGLKNICDVTEFGIVYSRIEKRLLLLG